MNIFILSTISIIFTLVFVYSYIIYSIKNKVEELKSNNLMETDRAVEEALESEIFSHKIYNFLIVIVIFAPFYGISIMGFFTAALFTLFWIELDNLDYADTSLFSIKFKLDSVKIKLKQRVLNWVLWYYRRMKI